MPKPLIYPIGTTSSCVHASILLKQNGVQLIDHPSPEVTHLLLDIPSREQNLMHILSMLPPSVTVIGGNLNLPDMNVWDFLQDEDYLCQNAAITAHCAIQIAMEALRTTLPDTNTLILGWGRIGKCLAQLLKALGCPVTVAVRNPSNRAMLQALGYRTQDTSSIDLRSHQLLFNTVPQLLLDKDALRPYPDLVKIDLASIPGLDDPQVISARGLPGRYAPESSGRLIAKTILHYLEEERS